jgi:aminopeptidase-like protein
VKIDSTLADGHLDWAELVLPGETSDEVLFSCHSCHPSLANDNLSSLAVATALAKLLQRARRRYTYRFLFIPGTIGAIAWLARTRTRVGAIRHGLVLACLGDPGRSPGSARAAATARSTGSSSSCCAARAASGSRAPFTPYGYDERQYNSPGFDLPVGRLTRTPNGEYPEYHTSADDLSLIRPDALADSLDMLLRIVEVVEGDRAT